MKKNIVKVLSFLFMMFLPLSMVHAVSAGYFNDNNVQGDVNHSVFVANDSVTYNHKVNGLAFIAGNNVNVKNVLDYGFIAGNNVTFDGATNKDLFMAGNVINISNSNTNQSMVGRDLYATGSSITINNDITGNAFIAGDIVTLNSAVINGDLNISANKLIIDDSAIINGNLNYNSDLKIEHEDLLTVTNKYSYNNVKDYNYKEGTASWLLGIAMFLVLAYVINLVFPIIYKKVNETIDSKSEILYSAYAFLGLILIPIISILIVFTMIGIELSILMMLTYVILLMLSMVVTSMVVGKRLLAKFFKITDNAYLSITVGVVVLKLISIIPAIGWLVYFIGFLYGLGKIFKLIIDNRKD